MSTIRDALFTSGSGQVMYLPEHDLRQDLGFDAAKLPPQTTDNVLALNKIVYIDHDRRTIYFYDKNGVLDEKSFDGAHKATDQEVRMIMEVRSMRAMAKHKDSSKKGGKYEPAYAFDDDGNKIVFDHDKDGSHEHDFAEGEFHPNPDSVGDLMPSGAKLNDDNDYDDDYWGGTPAFCYSTNKKFATWADAWLIEYDRKWGPKAETPGAQIDYWSGRLYEGKLYIALKAAQSLAKDYPALVKAYHEQSKAFQNAKVTDAPRVPHITWKFFPHQGKVLAMLDKQPHALIGVAAGGGKTLIAAADILNYISKGRAKRACIVMPGDGLVAQQKQEIKEFTNGTVNVICLTNDVVSRYCERREDGRYDLEPLRKMIVSAPPNTIILATYFFFTQEKIKTATKGKFRFPRAYWLSVKCGVDMVNIDECHKIKNVSDTSEAMLQLGELVKVRRGMSGTLIANNLKDIHRPGVFADASVLGDLDTFLDRYAEEYQSAGDGRATVKAWKPGAAKAIRQRLMSTCGIQVGRSHWMYMLPKFKKKYHKVTMSPAQTAAYKRLVLDTMRELEDGVEIIYDDDGKEVGTKPNAALAKLWKEFQAIPDDEKEEENLSPMLLAKLSKFDQYCGCPVTDTFTRKMLPAKDQISPKLKLLDQILDDHFAKIPDMKKEVNLRAKGDKKREWKPNMGKVIVFTTFVDVAMHLQANSKYAKQSILYSGSMKKFTDKDGVKKVTLEEFKTNPKIRVVFAVEQSMREGHNLQMANRVIRVNVPWNPGDIEQTKARTYRAGNLHPEVYEDVILCDGTAEIAKAARLVTKMHMNAKLLSDFDDSTHQQPIFMNKDTLANFTDFDRQLSPYLPLEQSIQDFDEAEAEELKKINGHKKLELGDGTKLKGSKTVETPYVDGDDEETAAPAEKPSKPTATSKAPAPAGATTSLEMLVRSYWAKSNTVIVRSEGANHPKLKRLGGAFESDKFVMRAEHAPEVMWIMDAVESLGIQVKNRAKDWDQWVKKNLPAGPPVKAKLPGKENVKKKAKYGVLPFEHVKLNGRSYVYAYVDDISPAMKTALKKINLKGESFKLLKNAGYHYEDINNKKRLFDLLRSLRTAGYVVDNADAFEKMVDKFFPGLGEAAVSIVSVEEAEEESEEEVKPVKKIKKTSAWAG